MSRKSRLKSEALYLFWSIFYKTNYSNVLQIRGFELGPKNFTVIFANFLEKSAYNENFANLCGFCADFWNITNLMINDF